MSRVLIINIICGGIIAIVMTDCGFGFSTLQFWLVLFFIPFLVGITNSRHTKK